MNKLVAAVLTLWIVSCESPETTWTDKAIDVAAHQYERMAAQAIEKGAYPRSIEPNDSIRWANARDWTSGFVPGSMFYLYELTGDSAFLDRGIQLTEPLHVLEFDSSTHDLGFMIYCSYGNAYRLSGNEEYARLMVNGANSLASRYDSNTGCIRSWDFGPWQYPVIIDNMMNLEYLFWAAEHSGDGRFYEVATDHANTTMQNHFRDDYSSYHVVDYDTLTGEVVSQGTFQGYSDSSAWSRGQGWALYGYTMAFRESGNNKYLEHARNIADFILNHPNMPDDMVPYWDFNAPDIPAAPRDASAAAVIASALLELSGYMDGGQKYYDSAEQMLKSLSSPQYLAEKGTNKHFILKHSTGFKPNNSEIDVPLNYADYYYLEALKRYLNLQKEQNR